MRDACSGFSILGSVCIGKGRLAYAGRLVHGWQSACLDTSASRPGIIAEDKTMILIRLGIEIFVPNPIDFNENDHGIL